MAVTEKPVAYPSPAMTSGHSPTTSEHTPATSSLSSATSSTLISGHKEPHNRHSNLIRDFIIGFSDGLTVPFALTASLTSLGSSRLVILGGLAELFSGAISMGLGAYLAAVTDKKRYEVEQAREWREVYECPAAEEEEIYDIFSGYGIKREESRGVVQGLMADKEAWVRFMMDFELRLEKPASAGAWIEGAVMGVAYLIGGILPMLPYFGMKHVTHALFVSIGITVFILVAFGYLKAIITGTTKRDACISAAHTLLVGVVAAGTSYGIVRGVDKAQPVSVQA